MTDLPPLNLDDEGEETVVFDNQSSSADDNPIPEYSGDSMPPIPPTSDIPPSDFSTDNQPKKKKTWIIIGVVLLILCCCVTVVGGAALLYIRQDGSSTFSELMPVEQVETMLPAEVSELIEELPEEVEQELEELPMENALDPAGDVIWTCLEKMGLTTADFGEGLVPVFCDDFDDNRNEWDLGFIDNEYVASELKIEDGALGVNVLAVSDLGTVTLPIPDGIPGSDQALGLGDFIIFYGISTAGFEGDPFSGIYYYYTEDSSYDLSFWDSGAPAQFNAVVGEDYRVLDELDVTSYNMEYNDIIVHAAGNQHSISVNEADYFEVTHDDVENYGSILFQFGGYNAGDSANYWIDYVVVIELQ
ncbi:MAG: hypothetical protein JW750_10295 [Anaerolineaceae bacterium]|nr:hypothetical protein [Anaerolineaceae bacterium]